MKHDYDHIFFFNSKIRGTFMLDYTLSTDKYTTTTLLTHTQHGVNVTKMKLYLSHAIH